jgi:hypothetical protein
MGGLVVALVGGFEMRLYIGKGTEARQNPRFVN